MGRIEKIVVSTVLFLVVVILAISLRPGGKEPAGPLANAPDEMSDTPVAQGPKDSIAPTSGPDGLLNAGEKFQDSSAPIKSETETTPAPATPPPTPPVVKSNAPQPLPGTLLLTTDGLQPSRLDNLMLYTWQAGDNFAALAQRYYGAATHAGRLRSANEGRSEQVLAAGEQIFVPSAEQPSTRMNTAEAQTYGGGSLYTVKKGDVLSTISAEVYGTSKKWKKIYEANQDVLTSPNAIKIGMQLRIPAE